MIGKWQSFLPIIWAEHSIQFLFLFYYYWKTFHLSLYELLHILWRTVIACHRMILTLVNRDKTCFNVSCFSILKKFYLSHCTALGWYTCVNLIICWRLKLKYIMLIRPAITWLRLLGLNLNWPSGCFHSWFLSSASNLKTESEIILFFFSEN